MWKSALTPGRRYAQPSSGAPAVELVVERVRQEPDCARERVPGSDERNARLVATTRPRADALMRIG